MNKVDFKLKVLRQEQRLNEKKEQTSVKLSCFMSGKKTSDGYENGIFFDVIVLPKTIWFPKDYSKQYIRVKGSFTHSDYVSKHGTKEKNFTIFADEIEEVLWD